MGSIPGPGLNGPGTSTGFNTISQSGLLASDFVQYDFTTGIFGTSNPNFSGGPMQLGIAQIGFGTYFQATQDTAVYDNLSLDLQTQAPEPSSLPLLALVLPIGWWFARKRAEAR